MSAVVMVTSAWQAGQPVGQDLDRPRLMLGKWRSLLEAVVGNGSAAGHGVSAAVKSFWSGALSPTQADLLEVAPSLGLLAEESRKEYGRQLDWLKWFTELRNATRGHGVVQEGQVAALWEMLYNVFLEMLLGAREQEDQDRVPCLGALLSARLLRGAPAGEQRSLEGWLRHASRDGAGGPGQADEKDQPLFLTGGGDEGQLALSPLLLAHGDDVLFWDGRLDRAHFQALSYATGKRARVALQPEQQQDLLWLWRQGDGLRFSVSETEEEST